MTSHGADKVAAHENLQMTCFADVLKFPC
jgi:hypothetical protein